MTESQIVSPQEAQGIEREHQAYQHEEPPICRVCEDETGDPLAWPCEDNRLAHTAATEPERTRAAVVRALRAVADDWSSPEPTAWLHVRADAIENGADW